MSIPNEIIHQLHLIDCEDAAIRFGLAVKGHMAHCFKHDDRITSLGFRKNHWKCFSCDIGGDAITFVQERFSVSFVDACLILAQEYGIPIPQVKSGSVKWKKSLVSLRLNVSANNISYPFDSEVAEFIMESTTLTEVGTKFLQGQRRIHRDVIEMSRIHSLDHTGDLIKKMCAHFGVERLKRAKILSSNGKFPTINAPALLIPYYDENETLISLQTRYLGEDNPDFHIPRFKRVCCSSIRLYNLPIINKIKRGESLFINEGITDCLAMLSAGYNAVALPSATSFPLEDLGKLKNNNLFMVADKDMAGDCAFMKLYRAMLRYGCEVKRVILPDDVKDYCEYYVKYL